MGKESHEVLKALESLSEPKKLQTPRFHCQPNKPAAENAADRAPPHLRKQEKKPNNDPEVYDETRLPLNPDLIAIWAFLSGENIIPGCTGHLLPSLYSLEHPSLRRSYGVPQHNAGSI